MMSLSMMLKSLIPMNLRCSQLSRCSLSPKHSLLLSQTGEVNEDEVGRQEDVGQEGPEDMGGGVVRTELRHPYLVSQPFGQLSCADYA